MTVTAAAWSELPAGRQAASRGDYGTLQRMARIAHNLTLAEAGARAYAAMCRGQALETESRYRLLDVQQHLELLAGKTGARLTGLDRAHTAAVARYGLALDVLFRLVDGLLDLRATAEVAGKPMGQDLANGVYILPVLLAAQCGSSSFTRHVPHGRDDPDLATAQQMATDDAVLAEVTGYARRRAATAQSSLRALAAEPLRSRLAALPDGFVQRSLADRTPARAAR